MSKLANGLRIFSAAKLIDHIQIPLYRNAYALILSTAATTGLGMFYWVLAARYYAAETVGLNSAVISTMMFLSGLSQLNLKTALVRFIPCAGQATARLVGYAYLASSLLAAVVGGIFVLGIEIWSPVLRPLAANPLFILWFISTIIIWCIFTLQDYALTGMRQTLWVPVENTIFAIAKIMLLIGFANSLRSFGIFASWTIPVVVSLLPINLLLFRRLIPRYVSAAKQEETAIVTTQVLKYVAGDYLGYLFFLASNMLLPLIVLNNAGPSASAYFYLPWIMATSLQLVTMNTATSFTVEAAAEPAKLGYYSRRFLLHMARLLLPAIAIVLLGAPFILSIFGATYAAEGALLLRLLALAVIPNVINALYISVARVQRRMQWVVIIQGATCLLALSMIFALLPIYGITGIGFALLTSETSVAIIVLLTQLRPVLR
jgi:O-antigen/teichoic acid export membrane protein